jgi:hypothetical protein
MYRYLPILFLLLFFKPAFSENEFGTTENINVIVLQAESMEEAEQINFDTDKNLRYFKIGKKIFKNPFYRNQQASDVKEKLSTIVIILLTGPLGGHRLYLGTKPVVPIAYAVTLGGAIGVLPIIDLFVIAFTKNISQYQNNDRIIMWIK